MGKCSSTTAPDLLNVISTECQIAKHIDTYEHYLEKINCQSNCYKVAATQPIMIRIVF